MDDSHLGLEESEQKSYEVNFRENISPWVLLCVEVPAQIGFQRAQKAIVGILLSVGRNHETSAVWLQPDHLPQMAIRPKSCILLFHYSSHLHM